MAFCMNGHQLVNETLVKNIKSQQSRYVEKYAKAVAVSEPHGDSPPPHKAIRQKHPIIKRIRSNQGNHSNLCIYAKGKLVGKQRKTKSRVEY